MTPPPPPLWLTLAQYWRLSERQTRQTWAALYRARWQVASAWRMVLVHFEGQHPSLRSPERVWNFLSVNVQPETCINVIEALISERLLSRREGSQIEEHILSHVSADGDWAIPKGDV
jgi:hypothetical protein